MKRYNSKNLYLCSLGNVQFDKESVSVSYRENSKSFSILAHSRDLINFKDYKSDKNFETMFSGSKDGLYVIGTVPIITNKKVLTKRNLDKIVDSNNPILLKKEFNIIKNDKIETDSLSLLEIRTSDTPWYESCLKKSLYTLGYKIPNSQYFNDKFDEDKYRKFLEVKHLYGEDYIKILKVLKGDFLFEFSSDYLSYLHKYIDYIRCESLDVPVHWNKYIDYFTGKVYESNPLVAGTSVVVKETPILSLKKDINKSKAVMLLEELNFSSDTEVDCNKILTKHL